MSTKLSKEKIEEWRQYNQHIDDKYGGRKYQSRVIRFCGARGSGKSLLLAKQGLLDLLRGRKVWSNMPIVLTANGIRWFSSKNTPEQLKYKLSKKAGKVGLKSEPLDWDALYTLSEDLVEGTVLIDEAQYFSDSRSALSLKNRLLNAIIAQVRKRNLNFYYTVKQGDWVDKRLTYETDIQVDCRPGHISRFGARTKLPPGVIVGVTMWDLSGVVTGRPVDFSQPMSRYNRPFYFGGYKNLHLLWDCYDTSQVVTLEEAFTGVQMDLKKRVISNKDNPDEIAAAIREVALHMADTGTKEINTASFWDAVDTLGIPANKNAHGKYLTLMGITRKQKSGGGYFYDLSGLE